MTPRRGKAVEINALWYNALRLLEGWLREEQGDDAAASRSASTPSGPATSFNRRFWYERGRLSLRRGRRRDSGDDPACRPNQLFAISLDHPVLDRARWEPVLEVVPRAAAHAGRACARWRRAIPDYKPHVLRRPARPRRRLPPGHGLGAG